MLEELSRAEESGSNVADVLAGRRNGEVAREIAACEERLERLRRLFPHAELASLSSHVKKAAQLLGVHQRTAPWNGQWE